MTGIVKLIAAVGYGFVIPVGEDGKPFGYDIYVPHSQTVGLSKGERVTFDVEELPHGKTRAINVRKRAEEQS